MGKWFLDFIFLIQSSRWNKVHIVQCFGFIHVNNVDSVCTGSGLHCWQIYIFSHAYALNFINHCFGSLFWLLGVPIGSLFHKKLGPFFKAWGSLLVRVTVHCLSERSDTIHSIHVTPHLLTCSKKLNVAEVACQLRSLLNNPPSPVQPFILKHFHQSQKYINVIQGGISALLVWRVGRFDTLGKLVSAHRAGRPTGRGGSPSMAGGGRWSKATFVQCFRKGP